MSDPALESTRRRLTARQADTVERLGRAAVELLAQDGFAALTVRRVAAEAGVGAATAYTYFSSKEHLVAEVFWRRLAESPLAVHETEDAPTRVLEVLEHIPQRDDVVASRIDIHRQDVATSDVPQLQRFGGVLDHRRRNLLRRRAIRPRRQEPALQSRRLADVAPTLLDLMGLNDDDLRYLHAGRFKKLTDIGGRVINEIIT